MARNLDDYVPVSERITQFYAEHPEGSLRSEIITIDDKRVVMRAFAFRTPDDPAPAVGHAEELRGDGPVNKTSAVENCETSAWGRAIAALGFEVKRGIASREEMQAVERKKAASAAPDTPASSGAAGAAAEPSAPPRGGIAAPDSGIDVSNIQDLIDLSDSETRQKAEDRIKNKGGMQKLTETDKANLVRWLHEKAA